MEGSTERRSRRSPECPPLSPSRPRSSLSHERTDQMCLRVIVDAHDPNFQAGYYAELSLPSIPPHRRQVGPPTNRFSSDWTIFLSRTAAMEYV